MGNIFPAINSKILLLTYLLGIKA
uniref:Uncharacterized protein n=1 Tax=Rhizophora mucronata TaxID=61149 RepID=A0A2P2PFB8_RHIMU